MKINRTAGAMGLMGVVSVAAAAASSATSLGAESGERSSATNVELQRQINVLSQEVQKIKTGAAANEPIADQPEYGYGPAASKVYRSTSGFTLGGYGEMLFESFRSSAFNNDGTVAAGKRVAPGEDFSPGDGKNRFDITRAVLYAGYKFDDAWVLNSEFEWEHGGGEIEVEFLNIDRFITPAFNIRAGRVLMPVGLTNELHEPTVYLGTHRTTLETLIVPTTWAEFGLGAFGDIDGFTYRTYLVSPLNASAFDPAIGIRESRHERGFANASTLAWVGRVDYTAVPGLLVGGSAYIGSATTQPTPGFDLLTVPMKLFEVHAQYNWHALDVRAMGAYDILSNIDVLDAQKAAGATDSVGSKQGGAYLQVGYDLLNGSPQSVMPFVRGEIVNTQMEVPAGYASNPDNLIREWIFGVNYKPIAQVVVKADYAIYGLGDGQGVNQFGLSLGYVF